MLHALRKLRELCDVNLPPYLMAQLIMGEKIHFCVPDCWQNTLTQVDYALVLVQAVMSEVLPAHVAKELTPAPAVSSYSLRSKTPRSVGHNPPISLVPFNPEAITS